MPDALHAYEPLREVADGVWCVDGRWRRSALSRRMTVLRLPDGGLAVHSAIRMDLPDLERLDRLGSVRLILVPNTFHGSEAGAYAARYPGARVLVPAGARDRLATIVPRIDGTHEANWPQGLEGRLDPFPLAGLRLHETLFLHGPSGTLVATDLVFHCRRADFTGLSRWLMSLNGAIDRFGPTRLLRWLFLSDRRALKDSLRPVLERDFTRVIMAHGHILESDGRARMERAFGWL